MIAEVGGKNVLSVCIYGYTWDLDVAEDRTEAQGDSGHTRISGNS